MKSVIKNNFPDKIINNKFLKIGKLNLSPRSSNCLQQMKIKYVGDLVQLKEHELLKIPNFGEKSLRELKHSLSGLGLSLGMKIRGWTPEKKEIYY